ncbi:LysR family transcriptional regulator [Eubacteriales bacterium]|nr:LysR family transcriptional regulator [Faecalicatena sp. BF-R-105]GKH49330.1 LysR family transcriptional regulator [Eubacteriales bacterium]GKH61972.1 LysR family transcriptional regulator [Eubacteriales bacterium]
MFSRDIDYFLAILKAGSISKAASLMYISQPSLSQFLFRLEKRLGVQLFDRSKTPWVLTDFGKSYAEYANSVQQMESRLSDEFVSIRNGGHMRQSLSIGIPTWKGSVFLPDVLMAFSNHFPSVSIHIYEEYADTLRDLLLSGEIDVAIMNATFYDKHIVLEKLFDERIFLVVSKKTPVIQGIKTSFEKPTHIDIRMFTGHRFIMPHSELTLTREVKNYFVKNSFSPHHTVTIKSILTSMNLAAAGYGCAFVPELGASMSPHFDDLAFFEIDEPPLSWGVFIAYRVQTPLSPTTKLFLDSTKNWFRSRYH